MSLAEETESRRERLLALRKRKQGEADGTIGSDDVTLSRRNFNPETRTIRKREPISADDEYTVEKAVEGMAEKILAEDEKRRVQELDLLNIAPKRANWDLKRDMQKKMAKLERKTQEAIHTLIRQRLASQKGHDDLLGAIRAQEEADKDDSSDDEE